MIANIRLTKLDMIMFKFGEKQMVQILGSSRDAPPLMNLIYTKTW